MAKVPVEAVSRILDNAYLDEIKTSSSEVTRVRGAAKVAGVAVLPAPITWKIGCVPSETVVTPDPGWAI